MATVNSFLIKILSAVVFRMYDLDGDNQISREEVLAVLAMMVGSDVCKEDLQKLSEITVRECGNNFKLINFDDFCKAMEKIDVEHKMSIKIDRI